MSAGKAFMNVPTTKILWLAAGLLWAASAVLAVEVWTPETGEVQLEKLPRDTATTRRAHALALIGAGQWAGGVAELRELIAADPEGEWVTDARLAMARGLLACGEYGKAFDELAGLGVEHAGSPLAQELRKLQFTAARLQAEQDMGASLRLYDRLIDTGSTDEERAGALKEKADVAFDKGLYLDAQDGYMALTSFYPYSKWAPYCLFRYAECEWEMAKWLRLGLERVQAAERSFVDFLETSPAHAYASEAKEKLAEVRSTRAALYSQIARFYMDTKRRPWAAINYLEYIQEEFRETPEAEWATETLGKITRGAEVPLRGDMKPLRLPGVSTAQPGD